MIVSSSGSFVGDCHYSAADNVTAAKCARFGY